ncbi:pituitary homeobox 2-like [Sycon ciliatum]|uniref:pituitary homeobox 2-like n=1 Tax=Sycon ciliatum TaxID=27933 RepID=UPI0031F60B24
MANNQQCRMCAVCNTRPAATDAMLLQPNAVMKCFWCASGTTTTPATDGDSGVVPHSTMPATTEDLQSMLMSPPLELSPTSHQHSSTHVSSSLPQHQTPQLGMSIADLWSGHTNDAEFELSPEAASPKGQTTSEGHIRTVSDSAPPGLQNSERSRSDEANKERGPRIHIKPEQLSVLMNTLQRNPKPPKHVQERVAKETGLTKRVVQVWFQNKRSKEKRIRMMQRPQFSDLALST